MEQRNKMTKRTNSRGEVYFEDPRNFYDREADKTAKYIDKNGEVFYVVPASVIDYMAEIEEVISACKTLVIFDDARELTPQQKSFCFYMSRIKDLIPLHVINRLRNMSPWWDDRERKKP